MAKKTSTDELRIKAAAGDAKAASALGLLMEIGLEAKPNVKDAKKFYEIAAKQGDPLAQLSLVDIVKRGTADTKPDLRAANELMKQWENADDHPLSKTKHVSIQREMDLAMKILVVDGIEDDRIALNEMLRFSGYKVLEAKTGSEGIGILRLNPDIKMVFTDAKLPELDGIAMVEKIRQMKQFESLPIVFVTAVQQPESISRAKKAGIHGWILKPLSENVITKAADRWMRNKSG